MYTVVVLVSTLVLLSGDVRTASIASRLGELHRSEHYLLARLTDQLRHQQNVFTDMTSRFHQLSTTVSQRIGKERYLTSPLSTADLLGRLATGWLTLYTMAGQPLSPSSVQWPGVELSTNVSYMLSRLQQTYSLKTTDLADGRIYNTSVNSNMTGAECVSMARQYYREDQHAHAVQWLNQALATHDNTVPRATILELAVLSQCFSGDTAGSLSTYAALLRDPSYKHTPDLLPDWRLAAARDCGLLKVENDLRNRRFPYVQKHISLCNGLGVRIDPSLKCRYVHYNKTRLRLAPFRLEEVNLDPPVVIFHNVISDNEINSIQEQAKSLMNLGLVSTDNGPSVSLYRTSEVGWLYDSTPTLDVVTRRMADMTGLDVASAEAGQVSRYGLGGEYMFHKDPLGISFNGTGDRIATLMFYLSDVEEGGNTVFLEWEASVRPQRGAAVFWFNLLRDGSEDVTSSHAGCPVLQGTKWVMNKWFHQLNNDLHAPCLPDRAASFKYFYL